MRADGLTDMTQFIVTVRSFANVPGTCMNEQSAQVGVGVAL